MGRQIEQLEWEEIEMLQNNFPKLLSDNGFKITSPIDPNYNCIAFACIYDDRWMWPGGEEQKLYDGFHFWPDGVDDDTDVSSFIEAFEKQGFVRCDNCNHEEGCVKVAFYVQYGTSICTHAAREFEDGRWRSKLGKWHDIQHSTPYDIEGPTYGEVYPIFVKKHKTE